MDLFLLQTVEYALCGIVTELIFHLVSQIDSGFTGEQECDHVNVALLGCQVERTDALASRSIGISSVLKQRGRYLHLVLFGSYVQRSIAVLGGKASEGDHNKRISMSIHTKI